MSFRLRPMQAEDYAAVLALWQSSSGMTLRQCDSRQAITEYLHRNPQLSQVLWHDDELVGAVLVGTDGRRGYLQHLAVATRWQRQGLGKQLLAASITALQSAGIDKTHLFIHNDNASALAFYRHLGWQERTDIRVCSFNASSDTNI